MQHELTRGCKATNASKYVFVFGNKDCNNQLPRHSSMMRQCGTCVLRRAPAGAASVAPSAACVVLFSSTTMHGDGGILSRVDELAASELLPGASTYCKACRKRTWLSDDAAAVDINASVLYFWHQWRANKRIASSMERMRSRVCKGGH